MLHRFSFWIRIGNSSVLIIEIWFIYVKQNPFQSFHFKFNFKIDSRCPRAHALNRLSHPRLLLSLRKSHFLNASLSFLSWIQRNFFARSILNTFSLFIHHDKKRKGFLGYLELWRQPQGTLSRDYALNLMGLTFFNNH